MQGSAATATVTLRRRSRFHAVVTLKELNEGNTLNLVALAFLDSHNCDRRFIEDTCTEACNARLGLLALLLFHKVSQQTLLQIVRLFEGQLSVCRLGTKTAEVDLDNLKDCQRLHHFAMAGEETGRVEVGEFVVQQKAADVGVDVALVGDAETL